MVLGLLILTSIPTVTGISFATSEQRQANARRADAKRMAKFKLVIYNELDDGTPGPVHGMTVALRHHRVYLVPRHPSLRQTATHEFHGFYIEYPSEEKPAVMGLVSSIPHDPPMLGWIYADQGTGELRYGNRTQSVGHFFGKWDWTEDESRVTFKGNERFFAVEVLVGDDGEELGNGKGKGKRKGKNKDGDNNDNGVWPRGMEPPQSEEEQDDSQEAMRWRVYWDKEKDGLVSVLGPTDKRRRVPIRWFRNPTGEPIGA